MLTKDDIKSIEEKNISRELIDKQLGQFKNGFAYSSLNKAATINDGIIKNDPGTESEYIEKYKQAIKDGLDTIKFVPASGAATRMFKALFEFIQTDKNNQSQLLNKEPYASFVVKLSKFAFYDDLLEQLGKVNEDIIDTNEAARIIECLLLPEGLNYGKLPKGLLKFHKQNNSCTTPLEEHLKEAAHYASFNNKGKVHFTVSPEHHELFKKQLAKSRASIENELNCEFTVDFSFQKQATDTIAVNPENTPFRQNDGSLLFRPAGHGALIENLNELEEELIFIKNIDNVVPEYLLPDTIKYKQLLAGILLSKKEQAFEILEELDHANANNIGTTLTKGLDFLCAELQMNRTQLEALSSDEKTVIIKEKLNKPIRVCGIVKNEGEAGGGPFWVNQEDGSISLQIVEGAQIDPNDAEQQKILQSSTHFNPVDLVCYTKNYKGEKFDLKAFVDPATGFISEKTQSGRPLKALELPGLWNGAMAHWLTFFVEVPVSTFNPVKTVMDLLRPQHQPE
ncbi:DUF4301 family protein [Carboxylicivirga marina]|uniref:DUF4301 family protein n=1 Tax=Carboxylicivirga marina TaxID=2800988 RepID=A0ABS1HF85_9BACT|nr:DUF4301 family protein [Carboxylicivirga marina]MBK3516303.1 DUF4301 family protein [Carboxylicivirga marina]